MSLVERIDNTGIIACYSFIEVTGRFTQVNLRVRPMEPGVVMPLFDASAALNIATIQQDPDLLKSRISAMYCVDESSLLESLIPLARPTPELLEKTTRESAELVRAVRARDDAMHMIDALLLEYSLDTRKGCC